MLNSLLITQRIYQLKKPSDMPHELLKEIETHLATFPERHKYVEEMKKEWKEFKDREDERKNKTLYVIIGFAVALISIGIWVGTIQTNIESVTNHDAEDKLRFSQLEQKVTNTEINNAGINARLASIESTLQEIKVIIKQIK